MGWFSSLFGDSEKTTTNETQTGFSQGNAWNDPRLQALINQIGSNTGSLLGGSGFAPINGYMTGAANSAMGQLGGLNAASGVANNIAQTGITPASIQTFQNPYTNDVVNASMADQEVGKQRDVNSAGGASSRNLAYGNST